jgi:ATP-dependent RNA helicase DDX19/DBP5
VQQDGFADDSVRLIKQLKSAAPDLQILLFSATFNEKVKKFAQKIVPGANHVFIEKEDLSLDVIKQYKVICPSVADKTKVLKDMIFPLCEKLGQTIIFVRTRETARALHVAMEMEGHKCTSIEGGMEKEARDKVVKEFREGTTKILISTDVLSRGFDVTQVTLVINFDVPTERDMRVPAYETYLHRIGRSGRFGRKGAAFNLVTGEAEIQILEQISDYFKHEIPGVPYDDDEKFEEVLKKAGLTN